MVTTIEIDVLRECHGLGEESLAEDGLAPRDGDEVRDVRLPGGRRRAALEAHLQGERRVHRARLAAVAAFSGRAEDAPLDLHVGQVVPAAGPVEREIAGPRQRLGLWAYGGKLVAIGAHAAGQRQEGGERPEEAPLRDARAGH